MAVKLRTLTITSPTMVAPSGAGHRSGVDVAFSVIAGDAYLAGSEADLAAPETRGVMTVGNPVPPVRLIDQDDELWIAPVAGSTEVSVFEVGA